MIARPDIVPYYTSDARRRAVWAENSAVVERVTFSRDQVRAATVREDLVRAPAVRLPSVLKGGSATVLGVRDLPFVVLRSPLSGTAG